MSERKNAVLKNWILVKEEEDWVTVSVKYTFQEKEDSKVFAGMTSTQFARNRFNNGVVFADDVERMEEEMEIQWLYHKVKILVEE